MPLMNAAILVCEDEPLIALDMEAELTAAGGRVTVATTLASGFAEARTNRFDVAVLDFRLGEDDCRGLADELEARGTPVLIYSGLISANSLDLRRISKPAPIGTLAARVEEALGSLSSATSA